MTNYVCILPKCSLNLKFLLKKHNIIRISAFLPDLFRWVYQSKHILSLPRKLLIRISGVKTLSTYLLTYLIGHNKPINGFRPAATHLSRRLCLLRAEASWSHPSFGPSNGYKVFRFDDFRRSPHQIPVLPEHSPPFDRLCRASAAAGY